MSKNSSIKDVAVVVPALNPGKELLDIVLRLHDHGFENFIVVNDGSDPSSGPVFSQLAAYPFVTVLEHARNCGKGRALKTAFNYYLTHCQGSYGVVTVDADGQHAPGDVEDVARALLENRHALVLGTRSFAKEVPFKSRIGNMVTRYVFRFIIGTPVSDTQTGLRGIPASLLAGFTKLPGERFEYEANMLISACRNGAHILEIPIKTIYFDDNRSSHFSPFLDSLLIYFVLLRFGVSSLITSIVDYAVFAVFFYAAGSVANAIVAGRCCAIGVNFFLNRKFVFKSAGRLFYPLVSYLALVAFIAFVSYTLIQYLHEHLGMDVLLSKVISELALFIFSFSVQHNFVFVNREQAIKEEG